MFDLANAPGQLIATSTLFTTAYFILQFLLIHAKATSYPTIMKRYSRPLPSAPVVIGALVVFSILAGLALRMLSITSYPVIFPHTTLNDSQSPFNITQQGGPPKVDPELDALRHIVSQTKGFYARDYSLWLGWNNVRPRFF